VWQALAAPTTTKESFERLAWKEIDQVENGFLASI